jgi:UDP-N-acetylglucosamine 2-epimerase
MGTRPEIIKMAPVYHELAKRGMQPLLLHTGQHSDMANPIYEFFDIVPDYSLHLQRKSDSLYHLSALLLEKLGGAFSAINPGAVFVHGDTTSAAMAALTAFYQKLPVGHVEAGLRSYQDYDPFPEEKNRDIIARLAQWHFAPTDQSVQNLRLEHIEQTRIHLVGNTVVDAVRMATTVFRDKMESNLEISSGALKKLPVALESKRLLLVTAHRRENLGEPLLAIARAVRELLESMEDFVVVWPVHSNPKVRATVHEVFEHLPAEMEKRIFLTKPLNYSTTLWLLGKAWLVLTDSGGIQEEAACMKAPVLVLRETTERPELIQRGGGMLIGTDHKTIVSRVRKLLTNKSVHDAMLESPNPFGDGYAAARICDIIARDGYLP